MIELTYVGDRLYPGQKLLTNQALLSPNQWFALVMQEDGNLVLYPIGSLQALWASNTDGQNVAWAAMQADGNFVIWTGDGQPIWATGTDGNDVAWIALQDDGNLVIYRADGTPIWASDTSTSPGGNIRGRILVEYNENGESAAGAGGPNDLEFENRASLPASILGPSGTLAIEVGKNEVAHIKAKNIAEPVPIRNSREFIPGNAGTTILVPTDNFVWSAGDLIPAGKKYIIDENGRFALVDKV